MLDVILNTARSGMRAVVLAGKVYVAGGFDGEERLSSVECFTPGSGAVTWHRVPDMVTPRSNFSMVVVDGKILVAGGYSEPTVISKCELYDPQSNTWSELPDMLSSRSALAAVVIPHSSHSNLWLDRE